MNWFSKKSVKNTNESINPIIKFSKYNPIHRYHDFAWSTSRNGSFLAHFMHKDIKYSLEDVPRGTKIEYNSRDDFWMCFENIIRNNYRIDNNFQINNYFMTTVNHNTIEVQYQLTQSYLDPIESKWRLVEIGKTEIFTIEKNKVNDNFIIVSLEEKINSRRLLDEYGKVI